jgi:hypothetical protein
VGTVTVESHMADIGNAMDSLMGSELYVQAAAGFAGYAGASVAQNVIDGRMDLPDEAYGVGVAAGSKVVSLPYDGAICVGAGVHAAEAAAERFGIKSTLVNAGSN